MPLTIRPLAPEDYAQAVPIYNAQNEPHFQLTVEGMQRGDYAAPRTDPLYRWYVAEDQNDVVALGYLTSGWAGPPVPGRYWTNVFTRRDYRNKGVDTRLLEHALHDTRVSAKEVWSCVRSDFIAASGYLRAWGFREQFRTYGSELLSSRVDTSLLSAYIGDLESQGIRLLPYAVVGEPAREEVLLALHAEAEEDAPHHEPIVPRTHPDFRSPDTDPESVFVAVTEEGRVVGQAFLYKPHQGNEGLKAGFGLTGVARAYRSQGIGTALKARAILYGLEKGYREFGGGGARENEAMLRVNRKLGVEIEPDWVTLAAKR